MLRTLPFLAVAVLLLGACTSGAATTAAPTIGPATVSVSSGGYFVGPTGFSLYTFDKDTLGHSSCSGDCLAKWPALLVTSTPEITVGPGLDLAEFTAAPRDDGTQQVTFKLIPLYYFANDTAAGQTNGEGVGGVWHLATQASTLPTAAPPTEVTPTAAATTAASPSCGPDDPYCEGNVTPSPEATATAAATPATSPEPTGAASPAATGAESVLNLSEDGLYLVDGAGMSLYTFDNDSPGVSTCTEEDCVANWPALTAADEDEPPVAGEGVLGVIAVIEREDGTYQVTYNELPLYHYVGDLAPGDVNGDGLFDVWHLASPEVPEASPGS